MEAEAHGRELSTHDILVVASRWPFVHHRLMERCYGLALRAASLAHIFPSRGRGDADVFWELIVADGARLLHMNGMTV